MALVKQFYERKIPVDVEPVSSARVAKAWAYVTYSAGTPTLQASSNVSGITDTATGRLTVTIDTDFANANWAAVVSIEDASEFFVWSLVSKAAGSVEIQMYGLTTAGLADPDAVSLVAYSA